MKIKIYTPICSDENDKLWFTVNGSSSPYKDEAIRITKMHSCFQRGTGKIERIDVDEVYEEDWYSKKCY